MTDVAHTIQAQITVDDRPCAVLSIENTLTGTIEAPTYRVTLDRLRERDTIVAEIKLYARAGKTRLDLITEAFRAISQQEATHANS